MLARFARVPKVTPSENPRSANGVVHLSGVRPSVRPSVRLYVCPVCPVRRDIYLRGLSWLAVGMN